MEYFEFSQSSLQDFVDCRKRFQLRNLLRVAWPAVQAEPIREFEKHVQRGERFHRLAQQLLLGIPPENLAKIASADEDEHLQLWWDHFLTDIPARVSGKKHVEATVTAPIGDFRLIAKYDLVIFAPDGRVVIFDWKTNTRRPKRSALMERLQTRVYPYLLVQAGASLNNGQQVSPDQIEMIYWFADPEMPPESIAYTEQQFSQDHQYLSELTVEIQTLEPAGFTMTANETVCRFCVYRSLCNRGTKAADFAQSDESEIEPTPLENLDFSLEQIGEIGF